MALDCDLPESEDGLRVGAFNVRIFGVKKFMDAKVVSVLSQVRFVGYLTLLEMPL